MLKEKEIIIAKDDVTDIQTKDFKVQTIQNVITQLMEMHALDENPVVLTSPVFMAYQDQLVKAKIDFESSKDVLVNKYLTPDVQKKVARWSLNYNTCTLTYALS